MADVRLDPERNVTTLPNFASGFQGRLKAGGTINRCRFVELAADGDLEQSAAGSIQAVGVYQGPAALAAGDRLADEKNTYIGVGYVPVEADFPFALPARIKVGTGGTATVLVDGDRSGDVILDAPTAGNFGNQPANDGVEIVSASAGDVQDATVWGTTTGTDTVVAETVTLDGTTPVATVKTDWGQILGVELSSPAVGTVTIREASADQAITTITAGNTTAGIAAVPAAQQGAWNVAPTVVADGASTKQVGLIGTAADGTALLDSQALNGTTPVTMNSAFRTVTRVLVGDVATGTDITVSVGAEDDENLCMGKALTAPAAAGDRFDAYITP